MTFAEALRRIAELEAECQSLRDKLRFLEYRPTLAAGFRGETLVARAVAGIMTVFTATNDVAIERRGLALEVKFSNLNVAVRASGTKRWTWARPLGHNHNKKFDQLILVGEADPRYSSQYRGLPSPYVIFDVPKADIVDLMRKSGTHDIIQISTNPKTARTPAAIALFEKYQLGIEELEARYGFSTVSESSAPISPPTVSPPGNSANFSSRSVL